MGAERRQTPRVATERPINLTFPMDTGGVSGVFGTIIDLSATGARAVIDPNVHLEVGEHVTLEVDGAPLAAQIVWRYDMWAGLQFERPITIN